VCSSSTRCRAASSVRAAPAGPPRRAAVVCRVVAVLRGSADAFLGAGAAVGSPGTGRCGSGRQSRSYRSPYTTLYVTEIYYGIRYGCCEWRGGKAPRQAAGHDRRAGFLPTQTFSSTSPTPTSWRTPSSPGASLDDDYVVVDHGVAHLWSTSSGLWWPHRRRGDAAPASVHDEPVQVRAPSRRRSAASRADRRSSGPRGSAAAARSAD